MILSTRQCFNLHTILEFEFTLVLTSIYVSVFFNQAQISIYIATNISIYMYPGFAGFDLYRKLSEFQFTRGWIN